MRPTTLLKRGALAAPLVLAIGVGGLTLADDEGGGSAPAPAGEPVLDEPTDESGGLGGDADSLISTGSTEYDETILTKFIPGRDMQPTKGSGIEADLVTTGNDCVSPDATSGGALTFLYGGVELPDGARIKRVVFYGDDNSVADDILVELIRNTVTNSAVILTDPSMTEGEIVDSFSTSGQSAGTAVVLGGADDLEELVGTPPGSALGGFPHRFHHVRVRLTNAAGGDHSLCGVEIRYQVPAASMGTEYHPLAEPIRVFDSRRASYTESGMLDANTSKVISIKDGYDLDGVAIPAQADSVPDGATAVTFNVTVAGTTATNFVSVTAGDATEYTTSLLNYGPNSALANSATAPIAADRTIKLWGGDQTGSTHILIDITGYYLPAVPSNMAN